MCLTNKELKVHNALRKIIQNKEKKSLNYAVNYAEAGLSMIGRELEIQCLYVLSNISRWRGEEGKKVRKILKDFTHTKNLK
jgi:hypothetical protein